MAEAATDTEDGVGLVVAELDKAFQYDNKVGMPGPRPILLHAAAETGADTSAVLWRSSRVSERIGAAQDQQQKQLVMSLDARAMYDLLVQDDLQARLEEANAIPKWVSSARQLADGLTKDSATQLLADRLRTHKNRLSDDGSEKGRMASASEFALIKAQYLGVALFAVCEQPSTAQPIADSKSSVDFMDLWILLITVFLALAVAKLLWIRWTWDRSTDQQTLTEFPRIFHQDVAFQADSSVRDAAAQTSGLGSAAEQALQTDQVSVVGRAIQTHLAASVVQDPGSSMSNRPFRWEPLPSDSSQVSDTLPFCQVGASVGTQTALCVNPVSPSVAAFISHVPGQPVTARGVPFEHRCPDTLRAHITGAGDARHASLNCASSRTRNPTRSLRPCRICTSGYTSPQLTQGDQG